MDKIWNLADSEKILFEDGHLADVQCIFPVLLIFMR